MPFKKTQKKLENKAGFAASPQRDYRAQAVAPLNTKYDQGGEGKGTQVR